LSGGRGEFCPSSRTLQAYTHRGLPADVALPNRVSDPLKLSDVDHILMLNRGVEMNESSHTNQISAMLRSHVERSLQRIWETEDLVMDPDEDYPFRAGTAACWVSMTGDDDPAIRVFGHAAHDVPKSARMLGEINELNVRAKWAKVTWLDGVVLVDCGLYWTEVNEDSLTRAMSAVCGVANDIGVMLATVFGGDTPFPVDSENVDEDVA
jgi:hypothetical protein